MRKTKVIFCIPNMVIGGVETVFVNTINELSKCPDLSIKIVTHAKIREPLYTDWLKTHPEIPVYVYYPLCNWFEYMQKYCKVFPLKPLRKILFSTYKKYRRLVCGLKNIFGNADIIIDYKNFSFFKELKNVDKPKVAWAHTANSYFENHGSFSRLPIYDKVVGITDDFVDVFKRDYPKYSDKVIRIYNPIDIDLIRKKAAQGNVPDEKYFCHVSRLVAGKDIKTLLDAFEMFSKTNDDVKLYIVGDGDMATCFKDYAKILSSCNRIVFTGALQNPYPIMHGAIANILSSEFEGLPTVLIESQALGVPMISSDCKNGPREILCDGKCGFLFDVGNAKQLSQCMHDIINKQSSLTSIIKNAKIGLERFNATNICKDIVSIFKDLKQ